MTTLIAFFILQANILTCNPAKEPFKGGNTGATSKTCVIGWDDND